MHCVAPAGEHHNKWSPWLYNTPKSASHPQPLTQAPCTPVLAHTPSLDTDRTRNARAPTSPRITGFCAIRGSISSSSSSSLCRGLLYTRCTSYAVAWTMRTGDRAPPLLRPCISLAAHAQPACSADWPHGPAWRLLHVSRRENPDLTWHLNSNKVDFPTLQEGGISTKSKKQKPLSSPSHCQRALWPYFCGLDFGVSLSPLPTPPPLCPLDP